MDLMYHSLNKSNSVRSPFDSAIQDIIKGKTIKVAVYWSKLFQAYNN
jgi:hypothetical protein